MKTMMTRWVALVAVLLVTVASAFAAGGSNSVAGHTYCTYMSGGGEAVKITLSFSKDGTATTKAVNVQTGKTVDDFSTDQVTYTVDAASKTITVTDKNGGITCAVYGDGFVALTGVLSGSMPIPLTFVFVQID